MERGAARRSRVRRLRLRAWLPLCVSGAVLAGPLAGSITPARASGPVIAAVSAGGYHTCALTSGGGVECWGYNAYGELGDGSTADSATPVGVSGLTSGVVAVSAGGYHTCALTAAGGVRCWGYNGYGQLGDGTTTDSSTPVAVSGLSSGVTAISAGNDHTCALAAAGAVMCWGSNGYGQLGNGSTVDSAIPIAVSGLTSGATAVSAGWYHSCAVSGGAVMCWGYNAYGQLGDATTTDSTTPAGVIGLSAAAAVSVGGDHTCALLGGGQLQCWGYNHFGQLGDGVTATSSTPVTVSGSLGGAGVSAGTEQTCALTGAGGVDCWGWNGFGQLGDGTTTNRDTPVAVSGMAAGDTAVTAGWYHTCALTAAGGVACWGDNAYGQLGNGSTTNSTTPVAVTFVSDADLALANIPAAITVDATGPGGATVGYAPPTVVDEDAAATAAGCTPAAGSLFAIGTTAVRCGASDPDDTNGPVTAGFTVTVQGAMAQLHELLAYVTALPHEKSLADKVEDAIRSESAARVRGACHVLADVIHDARSQRGRHLTRAQSDAVVSAALRIEAVLGCAAASGAEGSG